MYNPFKCYIDSACSHRSWERSNYKLVKFLILRGTSHKVIFKSLSQEPDFEARYLISLGFRFSSVGRDLIALEELNELIQNSLKIKQPICDCYGIANIVDSYCKHAYINCGYHFLLTFGKPWGIRKALGNHTRRLINETECLDLKRTNWIWWESNRNTQRLLQNEIKAPKGFYHQDINLLKAFALKTQGEYESLFNFSWKEGWDWTKLLLMIVSI